MIDLQLLKFSTGNGKLSDRLIFSIPAGYTCPHAGVCKTFADRTTGKITDLPQETHSDAQDFRCFAAMSETRPNVRDARWHNWDLLKKTMYTADCCVQGMADLIDLSIAVHQEEEMVRIHESGDFWTEHYMRAWIEVAKRRPSQKFYAYTKSLGMWISLEHEMPSNFYLTASWGGTLDHLISKCRNTFTRIAYVVYTQEQADALGLEVDHDDSHCFGNKPFALLVHASQRAGSDAMKALMQRRKDGEFFGYGKSNQK